MIHHSTSQILKKKHKKQNTRSYKKLLPFHMLERGVE
jgi:hypothetical protein